MRGRWPDASRWSSGSSSTPPAPRRSVSCPHLRSVAPKSMRPCYEWGHAYPPPERGRGPLLGPRCRSLRVGDPHSVRDRVADDGPGGPELQARRDDLPDQVQGKPRGEGHLERELQQPGSDREHPLLDAAPGQVSGGDAGRRGERAERRDRQALRGRNAGLRHSQGLLRRPRRRRHRPGPPRGGRVPADGRGVHPAPSAEGRGGREQLLRVPADPDPAQVRAPGAADLSLGLLAGLQRGLAAGYEPLQAPRPRTDPAACSRRGVNYNDIAAPWVPGVTGRIPTEAGTTFVARRGGPLKV